MQPLKRQLGALFLISQAGMAHADDLLTIYQQAVSAAPQLKTAQLKQEIGAAQAGQALGQMLPQVTGNANWSENQTTTASYKTTGLHPITVPENTTSYPGTRYYLSLNQTLVDFAKFWEWRRATKVEDQYAAEAIEATNQLILDVVDRYFSALEAQDQLYFVTQEKQATEKQLQQVKKQFDKQILKITDLYAVEARLDQLVADQILADSKRVTALQNLRELTGVMAENLSGLKADVEYEELGGNLQQWIEMAQSQNPLLTSKVIAIDAAENNVAVQKSKYLPVVDLQLNYYDTNTGYQSSRTQHYQTEVAAINVTMPIFSGGTTTHQLFEAQHRLELSKNDSEATQRSLIKETSDAFMISNASVRQIAAGEKALQSARKSRESMERGLQYGVVTVSDLLKAQQAEFAVQRDMAQARYSYLKNRVRFLHAIGSVSETNLLEINQKLQSETAAPADTGTQRPNS